MRRLLHFTRLEGGQPERDEEKSKGVLVGARRGGLGGVNRRILEGLCRVVEGLCSVVEGLCRGGNEAKLLILCGPVGFLPARRGKVAGSEKNRTFCANEGTGHIAASTTILPFSVEIQCQVGR